MIYVFVDMCTQTKIMTPIVPMWKLVLKAFKNKQNLGHALSTA